MNRVFKLLLITIFFTFIANAKMPIVILKSDKSIIKAGSEIKVTLGVKTLKSAKVKLPEIKNIAGYGIENKRVSTVSGKDVITRAVIYTITPTKSFTIKPYSVEIDGKIYKTNSLKIKVLQDVKPKNSSGFIFKMSSSKKAVVVGEPFIVSVELIEPIDVSSADLRYTPPTFKGFKATSLGDGEIIEKGNSVVRSLKYLVTAKKSGKFTISPAKAKIGIQMTPQAQSPFGFFGADIQWKKISSNSLTIQVYKKPNGVEVVGDYKIKASVDKSSVKASKPVTYTLIIEGKGNLDDFEDVEIDIPNVTKYSKDSSIEHRFEDGVVYSTYKKEYVFISKSSYTIPKVTIKAYSPNKHRVYSISSEAIKVTIRKTKTIASLLSGSSESSEDKRNKKELTPAIESSNIKLNEQTNKIENILLDKDYYKRKYSKDISGTQNIVIALLVGLIFGVLGGMFIPRFIQSKREKRGNKLYGSYKEAMHILYPHIDKDKKIEEMVKFLYEVTNGNKEVVINDKVLNKMVKSVIKKSK